MFLSNRRKREMKYPDVKYGYCPFCSEKIVPPPPPPDIEEEEDKEEEK
jgi:hypothetical protein